MNKSDSSIFPMVFESPVEFVLIGVKGKGRSIVAKSKEAGIDLAAYAQSEHTNNKYALTSRRGPSPFFSDSTVKWPISINSDPRPFPKNGDFDARSSELTLVWRGCATDSETVHIAKEFNIHSSDIAQAIDAHSHSQLEWALAPIIDKCNMLTIDFQGRRRRFRFLFGGTFLGYTIIIVVMFAWKIYTKL